MTYRQMPAAVEVEKAVLSACLMEPRAMALACEKLAEGDFWLPQHGVLFEAMREAMAKGESLDIVGVDHVLRASGKLQVVGEAYLLEVSAMSASDANLDRDIRWLREYATRRALIRTHAARMEEAFDLQRPIRDVLEASEAAILQVGDQAKDWPDLRSMRHVLGVAGEQWQAREQGQAGGVMTGLPGLDDILRGLKPGKLYVLAARPGLGKSMLALQVAKNSGVTVAHYSLEMYGDEQVERMVSMVSDLNGESLQSGTVIRSKAQELAKAVDELKDLPIWWGYEGNVTPMTILSQCRRLKKKRGLGLIIVDYLQLVESVGKFERRDLEVGFVSKFLKQIAMKLQVPVLTIASLSRKPEERTDKRPVNSDLRESGSIESDADGIIFIYREADYNKAAAKDFPNTTELIVSKHRGGRKGRAIVEFDGAHSKFYTTHPEDARRYAAFVGGKEQPTKQPSKGRGDFMAGYDGN